MSEKRIATGRVNSVLKKLFVQEKENINSVITGYETDTLRIIPEMYQPPMMCKVHKDLIIDFLIDYSHALENEIKALEEK